MREYLRHILDEINYMRRVTTDLRKEDFIADETLKRAIVRSLEIIGEAVKQLPADVLAQYSHIPWRAIARTRDRLIHHYFGVDYDIVWDVIEHHIAPLEQAAQTMLERLNNENNSS